MVLFLLLLRLLVDFPRHGGGGGGGAEVAVYSWKRNCSRRCSRRAEKSFETTTTVSFETLLFVYILCVALGRRDRGKQVGLWKANAHQKTKRAKIFEKTREQSREQHFSFVLFVQKQFTTKSIERSLREREKRCPRVSRRRTFFIASRVRRERSPFARARTHTLQNLRKSFLSGA